MMEMDGRSFGRFDRFGPIKDFSRLEKFPWSCPNPCHPELSRWEPRVDVLG
jgi:hypothetical protein